MSRRILRATIEPLAFDQWAVSGPWAELIVERRKDANPTNAPPWLVRHRKSEPHEALATYAGFERGLSDAYSRAMGYTR